MRSWSGYSYRIKVPSWATVGIRRELAATARPRACRASCAKTHEFWRKDIRLTNPAPLAMRTASGASQIATMQCLDLRVQRSGRAAVVDHVVGGGESLLAARLCGEDRLDAFTAQSAATHDPLDLHVDRTVDDEHPIDAAGAVSRLDQQRHDQHRVRAFGRLETTPRLGADHRVQD